MRKGYWENLTLTMTRVKQRETYLIIYIKWMKQTVSQRQTWSCNRTSFVKSNICQEAVESHDHHEGTQVIQREK